MPAVWLRVGRATTGETSPLHQAAASYKEGALPCVEWLLDQGVPVTATDASGQTVLQFAASRGRAATLAYLVQRGADPSQVDPKEMAPAEYEEYLSLLSSSAKR